MVQRSLFDVQTNNISNSGIHPFLIKPNCRQAESDSFKPEIPKSIFENFNSSLSYLSIDVKKFLVKYFEETYSVDEHVLMAWKANIIVSESWDSDNCSNEIFAPVSFDIDEENMGAKTWEPVKEFIQNTASRFKGKYKTLVHKSSKFEELRLFVSSDDNICYLANRSRTKGYSLSFTGVTKIEFIPLMVTSALGGLKSDRDYFLKNNSHDLWSDRRNIYLDNKFIELINRIEIDIPNIGSFDLYQLLTFIKDGYRINSYLGSKRLTLKSAGASDWIIEQVRIDLENKNKFRYSWEAGYDYSVSGECGADGIYRAWLNQEFRGHGNGHYYCLISATQAMHIEDD